MPLRDLWATAGVVNLSPLSMTPQGMIDELSGVVEEGTSYAHRHIVDKVTQTYLDYHTLTIAVPEFGVLCPSHDLQFLSILNDLYNCGPIFDERLRSRKKRLEITNPHISIISGTQPAFIGDIFPDAAYGMGFTSRIIMVYADTVPKVQLFANSWGSNYSLRNGLISDLKAISKISGPFKVAPDAIAAMEAWHQNSDETAPKHSRLANYNTRRSLHILKLMMVFSASRNNSQIIELCDFESSVEALLEAEALMPEIFRAMQNSSQQAMIEECFLYVYGASKAGTKCVPRENIISFLSARVPSFQVDSLMKVMIESKTLVEVNGDTPGINVVGGVKTYLPGEIRRVE